MIGPNRFHPELKARLACTQTHKILVHYIAFSGQSHSLGQALEGDKGERGNELVGWVGGEGKSPRAEGKPCRAVKLLLTVIPNTTDFLIGLSHSLDFFHETLIPSTRLGPA